MVIVYVFISFQLQANTFLCHSCQQSVQRPGNICREQCNRVKFQSVFWSNRYVEQSCLIY